MAPPQNLHNLLMFSLDLLHAPRSPRPPRLHVLHVLHGHGYLVVGNSQSQAKWGGEFGINKCIFGLGKVSEKKMAVS